MVTRTRVAAKLTASHYYALAPVGWQWITETPTPSCAKSTLWLCPRQHTVHASYQYIKYLGELRCKRCERIEKAIEIGKQFNLVYLDKESTSVAARLLWKCPNGHKFLRSLACLQQGKHKCTVCLGLYPKMEYDYHMIAEKIGYRWIGDTLPDNTLIPTLWLCDQGHKWQARYNQVQRGKRCPHTLMAVEFE